MFTIIVAIAKNGEIGKDNKMLWYLPDDLKFFRKVTLRSKIVMGRKTFESIPKRLKEREYIIATKNKDFKVDYATIVTDLSAFIEENKDTDEEIFVIGGASIYKAFLPYVRKMYITEIEKEFPEADAYFPKFDKSEWTRKVIYYVYEKDTSCIHVLYTKK